jgi:hypothetical protein
MVVREYSMRSLDEKAKAIFAFFSRKTFISIPIKGVSERRGVHTTIQKNAGRKGPASVRNQVTD